MSNTPNYDAKVKTILDGLTPGERTDHLTGETWMMTEEEIGWYKKFNVPPSAAALSTRWMLHGIWYVGYQYWYQKHPETGKPIICTVHPATGIKVLPDKEWFEKDFLSQGREYQTDRPFFEQWRALQLAVPMPANRNHVEPVNSIAFVSQGDEDSYFVGACRSKRTFYSHLAIDTEDSAEIFRSGLVVNSYNVVHSYRIHSCRYVRESFDCLNSAFLFDCRNCEFCFGATNKRNKKYLWFNEQLSKEEWERRMAAVDFGSRSVTDGYRRQFNELIASQGVWPENFNNNTTDSSGEYLLGTTKAVDCYSCEPSAVNLFSCNHSMGKSEDCAFSGYPVNGTNFCYAASGSGNNQKYCFLTIRSDEMEYCLLCYNCSNCFGCVGLQRKAFCIFNKQYTEEDYWRKVDEIKCAMLDGGEYGEFFPAGFSPSYWKDSGGQFWFGATDGDVKKLGAMDFDPESQDAIGQDLLGAATITSATEVPDTIQELGDEWINKPLMDEEVRRRFSFIRPEVEFYRKMHIAPPVKHSISRMKDLWREANMGSFTQADCAQCGKTLRVAKNAAHLNRRIYCTADYLHYLETNG